MIQAPCSFLITYRFFQICDTYSRHLYVPMLANTPVLVGSSKFRSRGRLPALSYIHSNMVSKDWRHDIISLSPLGPVSQKNDHKCKIGESKIYIY